MSPAIPRRARRALALATTAALAVAAPSRAAAQPACPTAPVETYYATGYECVLAGWRIHDLNFLDLGGATANGFAPSLTGTVLHPFAATDALGRTLFGFDFTGFAVGAALTDSQTGDEAEGGGGLISFTVSTLAPLDRLAGASLDFSYHAATTTPDPIALFGRLEASAFDIDLGGPLCLFVLETYEGPGDASGPHADDCAVPLPTNVFVGLSINAFLSRADLTTDPITGSNALAITRVAFAVAPTAVPEPSTLALLAAGLAVGAARRARRRVSGRPAVGR